MKKVISLLMAVLMVVALFAGCAPKAEETTTPPADASTDKSEDKPADETEEEPSAEMPEYDFSSYERHVDDTCPNGAVLYKDIVDEINTVVVPNKPIKLGVVWKHFTDATGVLYKETIEKVVADLNAKGAQIEVSVEAGLNGNDKEGQLAVLRAMVAKKYDVIVVSPISDSSLLPGIEEAIAAGIKLVTFQTSLDDPYVPYSISFSFRQQGELAAKWLSEKLPEGGKVAMIMGVADAASTVNVLAGFENWIKEHPEAKLELVDKQDGAWDRGKGNEIMASWLVQYPDLDAVFAMSNGMGLGALEAIKNADKVEDIVLLGRDGVEEEFEAIRAGEMAGTLSQMFDVAGHVAVQAALLAYNDVELPDRIWIDTVVVTPENVDTDRAPLTGLKDINYVIAD